MPWLVLGIAVVIGVILIVRGLGGIDPKRAAKFLLGLLVVVAGIGLVFLIARGGVSWIMIAAGLLLPALARWRAVRRFLRNLGGPTPGQASGVATRFLRMNLDHDSGILDGLVLDGRFRGRRLSEMSTDALAELLRECRVEDEQSATVLEAYLDRTYGASWRTGEAAGERTAAGGRGGRRRSPWNGDRMSPDEAYEILGLKPGASAAEIKEAHHNLMKKIHPDQGGSNYLATKINQAKDVLLDE
jgi:hypothetical protein